MPTNLPVEWYKVKAELDNAQTKEQRIAAIEKLIAATPGHKGCENLRAQLTKKLASFKKEKGKKTSRKSLSVAKEGAAQVCILGLANAGKSTFLKRMTNAAPEISPHPYTTQKPEVGTLDVDGVKIQLVEIPALMTPEQLGLVQNADLAIVILQDRLDVTVAEQRERIEQILFDNAVTTKSVFINSDDDKEDIKRLIWKSLGMIKVFTKAPNKPAEKIPVTFKKGATVEDVAKKIHKDFIKLFKYARIFGPSAKYPGERVGLDHEVRENDVVEIHAR